MTGNGEKKTLYGDYIKSILYKKKHQKIEGVQKWQFSVPVFCKQNATETVPISTYMKSINPNLNFGS